MRRLALFLIVIAFSTPTSAANGPAPFPPPGELATSATSAPKISPGGPPGTLTAEVLETLTVAAQRTACPGPPRVWQRDAVSVGYRHALFCLAWDDLSKGELASAQEETTTTTTTTSGGSISRISTSPAASSSDDDEARTVSQNIPTTTPPLPSINIPALEQCFHPSPSPSPSPSSSSPLPNCNDLLTQISTCHDRFAPWTDPYDSAQSAAFQACMCQTSTTKPFGPEGEVWRDFSACAECLTAGGGSGGGDDGGGGGGAGVEFGKMTEELERIENFCASQTPVAYLFLLRLVGWLGSLHPGVKLDRPPLSGDVMRIGTLGPKFTTTAPLVNLAWGASAPSDGSLKDVRPSLTTWTLTSNFAGSHSVHLVTSFVTWLPTATAVSTTIDPKTASSSAAARISEELGAALSSMAADAGGQGGPSGKCIGDCPDKKGQAVGNALSLGFMLATVGMVLGLLLVS
ncbi:hypothetical protein KC354_g11537 [Hortaea werneckii]|nr:hypothetical protein KC354_g11537 [Hortaea werneckii]